MHLTVEEEEKKKKKRRLGGGQVLRFVGPQQFLAPDRHSLITTQLCGCDEEGDAGLPSLRPLHLSTARRAGTRENKHNSQTNKAVDFCKEAIFLQPPHKGAKDKLLRQLPWF